MIGTMLRILKDNEQVIGFYLSGVAKTDAGDFCTSFEAALLRQEAAIRLGNGIVIFEHPTFVGDEKTCAHPLDEKIITELKILLDHPFIITTIWKIAMPGFKLIYA